MLESDGIGLLIFGFDWKLPAVHVWSQNWFEAVVVLTEKPVSLAQLIPLNLLSKILSRFDIDWHMHIINFSLGFHFGNYLQVAKILYAWFK